MWNLIRTFKTVSCTIQYVWLLYVTKQGSVLGIVCTNYIINYCYSYSYSYV